MSEKLKGKYWATRQLHQELGALLGYTGGDVVDSSVIDPDPGAFRTLGVPYNSQWEDDAGLTRSDCGPACVEMVGEFMKPQAADIVSTDDVMKHITGGVNRPTTLTELAEASEALYGVKLGRIYSGSWDGLRLCIRDDLPVIALVHYGSFPTRIDRSYVAGHFMVVVGFDSIKYRGNVIERVIVHDPDFYGEPMVMGAYIPIVKDVFLKMWSDCYIDGNPNNTALVPEPIGFSA